MTTIEIANMLVQLCREGKNYEATMSLYADGVVSVEASAPEGVSREVTGRDAVLGKGQWWVDNHEIHEATVTGPWPNGDQFIVGFRYDVTFKPSGKRFVMEEMALYTVQDGKISHEAFFYSM
jgi:ketosteroid isomerase-like protein